ncbi:RNA cytidine acetyltransferase like protein [Verticillium longisporum]|uniref:RNA cytidine acetyltransferase n=1 Tax=Verticillium longisporum TaxID=100787 RepID=A0A8I3AYI9_VERLO|nr:RNA cytidine acetyltransferase like protein [Verticillium longisporum]
MSQKQKQVDSRIPALIRNGLQEKKRSFFVVVGDRGKDIIVNLHHIMSQMELKQNKSVLWAYKSKLLNFTSHRQKRENKIKKEVKRGIREANDMDPFEAFVTLHNIRYVYYKETEKVLGNTFGMCVLQDFEALTPNILAKTMETVEGGGLVILLLKGMNSLKQLYNLSMDVHNRYRTEAHDDVVARFNERFILSLGGCDSCLVIDDEMNVLPISGGKNVTALPPPDLDQPVSETQKELDGMKESLQDTQPVGSLVTLAKTVDQAKALLTFVDAIAEKTLRSTVTLTAARGRGKSAAMGVAVAAAVAHGYSNIFITSPSPENLKTLFEFIFKGFDALGYADHADYSIIQSTNPDFNKAIVRVNIHRQHRQTIQYIRPQDAHVLGQAELVVIDEAAAIPLPLVRKLMGPYLVFMASTINGYEGTGRSLSLKLIKQLREQSRPGAASNGDTTVADRSTGRASKEQSSGFQASRSLREITLSEPIRYAKGDSVEKWLNTLLCLDATLPRAKVSGQGCPDPSQCELLQVNRDTLFSFHPVSEKFLQQMVALYVASHYKNSPDDLQLMSDAPAHELYVLVPPVSEENQRLPEPLCVIQVSLEGKISRQSVLNSLSRGQRPSGDLIPWLVSQQFQDEDFASLSGARVVRIATNPEYMGMGYGSKALQLLTDFYEGKFTSLNEEDILDEQEPAPLNKTDLDRLVSPFDLKRLESYANNMLDYHVILDLIPTISNLYFTGRLKSDIRLTGVQQAILLAIGEQRKDLDVISTELSLPSQQLLAMFIKILRKVTAHFTALVSKAVEAELPQSKSLGVSRENATGVHDDEVVDQRFQPLETTLDDELEEGGDEVLQTLRKKQRELIDSLPLDEYEIEGDTPAWQEAEAQVAKGPASTVVSVKSKSKRKAGQTAAEVYDEAVGEKSRKKAKKGGKRDR